MNNNVKIIITFALGAAVGVVATQRFFKKKYEAIAQEEIDSVKEVYSKKEDILTKTLFDDASKVSEDDVNEYTDLVHDLGYTKNKEKGGSEPMNNKTIEVIPPDEFGEYDEYDCIGLTYYANGILTDDGDFPIEDVEGTVGPDALDSFGEWEDDTVYVRNDDRGCYYEICRDIDNYDDSDPQVDE